MQQKSFLSNSHLSKIIVIILTVLGTTFGYPNEILHVSGLAIILPLGLTLLAYSATNTRNAISISIVTSFFALLPSLYWLVVPIHVYSQVFFPVALIVPILFSFIIAIYLSTYALFARFFLQNLNPLLGSFLCGLTWACMEMFAGWFMTGFPWMTLSSSFIKLTALIQISSVIGAYLNSGLLVFLFLGMAFIHNGFKTFITCLILFIALAIFGVLKEKNYIRSTKFLTVGIVQGNIDQNTKWDPLYQKTTLEHYIKLTKDIVSENPRLIVWPETALPFFWKNKPELRDMIISLVKENNFALLTGNPDYEYIDGKNLLFNKATLFMKNGQIQDYTKEHLVPFGEYLPFANFFDSIEEYFSIKKLTLGRTDFSQGINNKPIEGNDFTFNTLICYEAIFPYLTQKKMQQGADFLVNISNDAWFGDSSAPYQHLALTTLRAIESDRWIVRATNNGISTFISPLGKIVNKQARSTAVAAIHTIELRENSTFYSCYGSLLHKIAIGLFFLTFFPLFIITRKFT